MLTTISGDPLGPAAFGAMQFGSAESGGGADEGAAREMIEASLAAGIRHFDTAYVYTKGESEKICGRLLGPMRDKVFIATKGGMQGDGDAANMRAQLDESLMRLGLDSVDLLYQHKFCPKTPLRETMEFFAEEKAKGRIRHVGLSNYAAWQVVKAEWVAAEFDLTIDALQPMYNLVKRQAEVEILPMCKGEGIAAFAYSPLGGGLLTGKYAQGEAGRLASNQMYSKRYGPQWMHDAAAALARIAAREDVAPATLAVAWAARNPFGAFPIVSAKSPAQLQPSLDGLSFAMSDALYAEIAALSPAPPPATDRLEEAG